ncbi:MAG: hypothetical protein U0X93_10570 [Anaerolineales bacterium]
MPQATYHFPRGFLWGTATSSHQVEGNNTNNQWWKWEQDSHTNGTSGLACDWWGGRWREDFDRAAEVDRTRIVCRWSGAAFSRRPTRGMKTRSNAIAPCCADCANAA